MTISAVGSTVIPTRAVGLVSASVTPANVGDCWILATQIASTTISVASVSGGGVTTWTRLVGPFVALGGNIDLWLGKITALGASTITISGTNVTTTNNILMVQEFTNGSGAGTTWAKDGTQSGTITNSTASATGIFPTLTASAAGDMYVGYSQVSGSANLTGQTSGYTVVKDGGSNPFMWNPSVLSGTQSPTVSQSSSTSGAIAALVVATASAAVEGGRFLMAVS